MTRFELATPRPPDVCATGLRYIPNHSPFRRVANVNAFSKNQLIFAKFYSLLMKILLKQVVVADPGSPHNDSVKDVLISNGIIERIDTNIDEADEIIQYENVTLSPGWVDVF